MHVNPSVSKAVVCCLALALSFFLLPAAALALSPEHEAERLVLATEQAFANDKTDQAEQYLREIRSLGIAPPVDYFFLNGKLLVDKQLYTQARQQLEGYIDTAGKSARFYHEALSLITQIESNVAQRPTRSTASNRDSGGKVEINWSEDKSDYLQNLLGIYQSDNSAEALTRHINSLLKFYAYSDDRIIAASRMGTPSRHQLHTTSRGEIVSMNKVGTGSEVPYIENRFSVYGINPYINYRCSSSTANCWLLHPVTSQRWLQVVNNREAVAEITKALSLLIKDMQQSG